MEACGNEEKQGGPWWAAWKGKEREGRQPRSLLSLLSCRILLERIVKESLLFTLLYIAGEN